ncbi:MULTISPECIES: hypothetical protein [unclassified Moorena]|uniref:hypothetical protein n=1 Tax=unclassified Moorena TaxID=2683338 RepID=UPI0025DB82E1|nr:MULTISPECIES: hypothetical protein [unclassified Moorena]
MTNNLNKDPQTHNQSCAKAQVDGYQQALTDFGITELLAKLSHCSETGFHTRLPIQPMEADAIAAVLIQQLTTSLNPSWLAPYFHGFQHHQGDILSDLVTLTLKQLPKSTALPEEFRDHARASCFDIGERIYWKPLADSDTDFGIVIGKFYSWANHCCCWMWCYLIVLDSESPSALWTVTDIAWENNLVSLALEVAS